MLGVAAFGLNFWQAVLAIIIGTGAGSITHGLLSARGPAHGVPQMVLSRLGFGYWVVEEKSTGRFAGEVGFSDWKREINPSLQGLPELGWVLASRVHGQGYATEAARAAIRWANVHFSKTLPHARPAASARSIPPQLKSARITCIIYPANVPSIRVAEKCGFKKVLRTLYQGKPTIVFAQ